MALIQINPVTEQVCHRPDDRDTDMIYEIPNFEPEYVTMFYMGTEVTVYFSKNASIGDGYCHIMNTLPISFCGTIYVHYDATQFVDQLHLTAFIRNLTENVIYNT